MKFAILFTLTAMMAISGDTRYYLVEGVMKLPDGRNIGITISIVKRDVDRDGGRIEETVLSLRGKEPAKEFITVITPGPGKAAVTSPQGGISGEATLSGPEWAWTRMTFSTKAGGSRVVGEDQFSPDAITAKKEVFDSQGRKQVSIEESGRSITKQAYEMLRSRLIGQ